MRGRRVGSIAEIEQPGDYFGPTAEYTGDLPAGVLPQAERQGRGRAREGALSLARLEIRQSISNLLRGDTTGQSDDGWHGYLDEGHSWRQA